MALRLEKPSWRRIHAMHCGWSSGVGCAVCGSSEQLLSFTMGHPINPGLEPFLVVCDGCFGDMQHEAYRMLASIAQSYNHPDKE